MYQQAAPHILRHLPSKPFSTPVSLVIVADILYISILGSLNFGPPIFAPSLAQFFHVWSASTSSVSFCCLKIAVNTHLDVSTAP